LAASTGSTPRQAKWQSNGIVMLANGIPDGIRPSPTSTPRSVFLSYPVAPNRNDKLIFENSEFWHDKS
jgi:hypothetical protein